MKKLLALALSVVSIGFAAVPANTEAAESSTAAITANAVEPQIRITIGRNRNRNRNRNRRARVVTQTRVVRYGRYWYRETIQIKYLPNGRTETRVISRVRIRRY
jgi:hypothetical protein